MISPSIIGGRPGGSIRAVVDEVSSSLTPGCWVLRWDIQKAFYSAKLDDALDALLDGHADPGLAELVGGWYRRQHGRFGGLAEGSPVSPLLLAALLDARLVPVLGPHAAKTRIWVDDGITVLDAERDAHELRANVERALRAVGLSLHPDKTGVHRYDASTISPWEFLGLRWHHQQPNVDDDTINAVLDGCRYIIDTVDEHEKQERKIRRRVAPWLGHYVAALPPAAAEQLQRKVTAAIGYVYEPVSVGTAGSQGALSPRAGGGYVTATQAGRDHRGTKYRRKGRDVRQASQAGHDHAPSGEECQPNECGLAVPTTYGDRVHDVVADLRRRNRSLVEFIKTEPLFGSHKLAALAERALAELDVLRRAVARQRWNARTELVRENDFLVLAGLPEELGFIRNAVNWLRKKTRWTHTGSNVYLMALAFVAREYERMIVPVCPRCGHTVRPIRQ